LPDVSAITITSQSLNFPTFFKSSENIFDPDKAKIAIDKSKIFLIMDMDLEIFFEPG